MRTFLVMTLAALVAAGCGPKSEPTTPATAGGGDHAAAPAGGKLVWTAIPDANAEALKAKYDPISTYLAGKLGVEVEYKPVADYSASVEGFKAGSIQLAWFGGLTGVQARAAVPGAVAIAQGEEDPVYKSYFIVHKDTGIEKSDEFPMAIANFPFAFGSESSTSGRLMPEYFLRKLTGKGPKDFFTKGFEFTGAHDKTALAVQEGSKIKCGVLNYGTYDQMVKDKKIDPEVCRIVWTTPTYADYNFTSHPRLEEMFGKGFTEKLQQALIDMKDPALLGAFPRKSLIKASNADFANIESVAKDLGLLR